MADTIRIDIVSDVICPWCFLGKRRLDLALKMVPEIPFEIVLRPFQLDPTVPKGGVDRRQRLADKFGGADRVRASEERLTELGREIGVAFHWDDVRLTPNTLDAHRLIRWGTEAGIGPAVADRLFEMYFSEGRDIGDVAVLTEAAAELGLDADLVAERLPSEIDADSIRAEVEEAQRIGVTGVPCFILDRRYAVMGAQEVDVLAQALKDLAEEMKTKRLV